MKQLLSISLSLVMLACTHLVSGQSSCELQYDGDGDGIVTVNDMLGLLGEFGQECTEPYSLIGRWQPETFLNTLYEFTDSLRYTIYSLDGTFGGLDDAIPGTNPWHMEGDTVVIDLHFGNEFRGLLTFSCEGQVANMSYIDIFDEVSTSVLIEEGVDPADCD
ncbi:MAG: hypothetical protein ACKVJH_05870 [Flavobacteriales bacterium]